MSLNTFNIFRRQKKNGFKKLALEKFAIENRNKFLQFFHRWYEVCEIDRRRPPRPWRM